MSATIPCPSPSLCGVRAHRVGTAAARSCAAPSAHDLAAYARPPRPPDQRRGVQDYIATFWSQAREALPSAEGRSGAESVDAALRAELERADAAASWSSGCGRPHPSGGYSSWKIETKSHGVSLAFCDENLVLRRVDGAALAEYSVFDGGLRAAEHYEHGQPHRADGPSDVMLDDEGFSVAFYHRDVGWVTGIAGDADDESGRTLGRYGELVDAGASASGAMDWLLVERRLGREETETLIDAGAEPGAVRSAIDAGVLGLDALVRVGTRSAPLSWAAGRSRSTA